MASLANGGLHTRLGLHLLNTEQRGSRTATKMDSAGSNGQIGQCHMDLPGPTTSVGTRTDYSVGP
jgi:hypothetical protein